MVRQVLVFFSVFFRGLKRGRFRFFKGGGLVVSEGEILGLGFGVHVLAREGKSVM